MKRWIIDRIGVYAKTLPDGTPVSPFNFSVVSERPLVLYTTIVASIANVFFMAKNLSRPANFIVGFSWDFGGERRVLRLAREYRKFLRLYKDHSLMFICNSNEEVQSLSKASLPHIYVNKNAFLNLDVYRPIDGITKEFDAVMNARVAPYKRFELASKIENLALITSKEDDAYEAKMRRLLKGAIWLNYEEERYRRFTADEVAIALNRAMVGVILSRREGQCQASAEYLLAGLPVVSTESKGGRDVFFDSEYVAVVEDHPEAVRDAVHEMRKRDISPDYIRNRTVEKVLAHRERFVGYLNEVVVESGGESRSEGEWFKGFPNKLKKMCPPEEFVKFVSELSV